MSTYGNEPQDPFGKPPSGSPVPPPGGEIPTAGPAYGQPSYGQPNYGQADQGQNAYGQPAYGAGGQPGQPGFGGPGAPYAHWIKRVGAFLIDNLIIAIPAFLVGQFVSSLLGNLVQLGLFVWILVWMQGTTGYSIGKQVLGIKLVNEQTGQPIGAGMSFVRQLAHILDALACLIGYLWPLWDAKRQTFADKLLTTIVIEQPKS